MDVKILEILTTKVGTNPQEMRRDSFIECRQPFVFDDFRYGVRGSAVEESFSFFVGLVVIPRSDYVDRVHRQTEHI